MHNVYTIARKEFTDLVSSPVMLFTLVVYLVLFAAFYSENYHMIQMYGMRYPVNGFLGMLTQILCSFGSLVAIILGLSVMYNETQNYALNTLVVKPVYRDTILNGKILGVLGFTLLLFVLTTALYISVSLVLFGDRFGQLLAEVVSRLPLVFLLFILCFMFFFLLTMLFFILIRNNILALLLGFIAWVLIYYAVPTFFATYAPSLAVMFGLNEFSVANLISGLSPQTMIFMIFNDASDVVGTILCHFPEFGKLSLYTFIILILCYIAFLRRDV